MNKIKIDSKRAVIYCRVSTEEQAKDNGSLASQERVCIEYATRRGFEVVERFIEGATGRNMNRPKLQQMLAFCTKRNNNISAVICLKVDRLNRNIENHSWIEKFLFNRKIDLLFVEGNNEKSAMGKAFRAQMGVNAELESDLNSERTKAGNTQAFLSGRYIKQLKGYSFGNNPYGKRQIYPNEDAKFVIKGFELMSKGVYSQREVLAILMKEGFKSYPQAFNKILHNSVYCGLLPDTQNVNNGESVKGIHEPLISEGLFNKVQDIMRGRRPTATPRKRNNPIFPLRKFIRCKKCGQFMTASHSKGKLRKYAYYHCSKCASSEETRILKEKVEPVFMTYLKSLRMDEDKIKQIERTFVADFKDKTRHLAEQRRAITKMIQEHEEEKSRLISLAAKGTLDAEDIKPEIERLKAEINEKNVLLADSGEAVNFDECWEFTKFFVNNIAEIWDKADLDLKQKLQCLISPQGFYFSENLIKHQKSPYFLSIFSSNNKDFKSMGG
ncbi:Site-specific DNA recombinase [Parelusimicrobium proximum]|uniref:recombinase family protein n=1 Tax=Parelusimicrobium proximum TaxID=3228953 RepID=UPI003D18142F